MAAAMASLYTGRKVRFDTSMTGEITLFGLVFPVGGVKEKVLAAHRAGIRRIILPDRNVPDIEELPDDVKKDLKIIPVARINDVFAAALEKDSSDPALKNYSILAEKNDGDADRLIAKEN